jgi:hypothetical protein
MRNNEWSVHIYAHFVDDGSVYEATSPMHPLGFWVEWRHYEIATDNEARNRAARAHRMQLHCPWLAPVTSASRRKMRAFFTLGLVSFCR